jgi:hypothetical protein
VQVKVFRVKERCKFSGVCRRTEGVKVRLYLCEFYTYTELRGQLHTVAVLSKGRFQNRYDSEEHPVSVGI